ncbi:helix-turn-helix transcriptional regulator [Streptomyces sp. SID13666]|uniref:helix-turn-helix transcriptional regulator n=1 Tax=unclassified Streptomyces TaxID=2593676 RepID=UPI0013C0B958|nr:MULTISPECIES: helix-turn-helix transcriptional regulator [unclassified Streptomyces]MCZ4098960.1 XRE family transcriptional regulator [Streptomyces sp. H39-C1]NEA60720.1 helix-turn-helix transcriptional regulator [Streptomyces sp. SID13666]
MELDRHPLAYLRRHHHWSGDDLARLLRDQALRRGLRSGIDRNRIWLWESTGTTPSQESQSLLAAVLDVPAAVVEQLGWPHWLPAFEYPAPFNPSGSRAALKEVQVNRMERRSFLILSSSTLIDVAASWARIEPRHLGRALDGQSIDGELLTWLEQRSGELRALAAGPHPQVSRLIDAHLSTAIDLITQDRYTTQTGRRLHAVTADLAHCAAWLRFDADRHADAQRHWQAAVHAAHQADDRDLAAIALSDLAYQATWLSRPADAVRIIEHARTRTRTPAARSLLDVRRARACAVLQDRQGTQRALTSAEMELARMNPQDTPSVVSWMSMADINADAGRCWLDLGDPHRAETAISAGLGELDPRRSRTKAVFLTYRAEASLHDRDAFSAAANARAALDTALDSQASRCVDLASALIRRLDHRTEQPMVELREYAREQLAG